MNTSNVTNLSGRSYALYAGVLHEAHEKGLIAIHVELIQVPTEANRHTAIAKAIVRMTPNTPDGPERIFEDLGDANPQNCPGKQVALHLIRMASTRAKGRALRDAIDCAHVLAEELGDDEEPFRSRAPERYEGEAACSICGTPMTKGQVSVSMSRYQRPLCPTHQKTANAVEE